MNVRGHSSQKPVAGITPAKTHIFLTNQWLEDEISIWNGPFFGYTCSFSEGGGQIALTDLRHLEHARELFKKWGFRRIEDGKLRTSFIFVGTNHSPPGNHHIPPEEKENHLQMCLGWGYVGSVEGRFLGNQILMGHILSLTRSCGRCVAFAYVQGRLQVIYIYLLREYMFPLWLEDLLTRTNIVKPT